MTKKMIFTELIVTAVVFLLLHILFLLQQVISVREDIPVVVITANRPSYLYR